MLIAAKNPQAKIVSIIVAQNINEFACLTSFSFTLVSNTHI